jgi:hypothetical protein
LERRAYIGNCRIPCAVTQLSTHADHSNRRCLRFGGAAEKTRHPSLRKRWEGEFFQ